MAAVNLNHKFHILFYYFYTSTTAYSPQAIIIVIIESEKIMTAMLTFVVDAFLCQS